MFTSRIFLINKATLIDKRGLYHSWHHCTHKITSFDAVPVTCIRVGPTVPTTALALMQYQLLPLQLAPLCRQQY